MTTERFRIDSPLGPIAVVTEGGALLALDFVDEAEGGTEGRNGDVARRLDAYFQGELEALDPIDVAAPGTEFERAVWSELRRIPVGTVTTYRAVAAAIGRPAAVRAVGRANARNRCAIVVPCHRVIASDGALRGYAGGLERKAWLLRHEGALIGARATAP